MAGPDVPLRDRGGLALPSPVAQGRHRPAARRAGLSPWSRWIQELAELGTFRKKQEAIC